MKPQVASAIALGLVACQLVGGFEDYARGGAPNDESSEAGASGSASLGTAGATSGGAPSPSGGASGGAPSPSGGASGGLATGGENAGGDANGGMVTGGTPPVGGGATASGGTTSEGGDDSGQGGRAGAGTACSLVTERHPEVVPQYVDECLPTMYTTNPPCGGPNYDIAAGFQVYGSPIPDGYMVHSLEHGGIVVLYNCPNGCADEVARAEAWMDNRPEDLSCLGFPWRRRALLSPDPDLPTRWAAVAWGVILRASCFDEAAFSAFYEANYNRAPEDSCIGEPLLPNACAAMPGGS